ncbi:MAG: hypothetical protein AAF672_04290 [Pseudomonadota bacterium]
MAARWRFIICFAAWSPAQSAPLTVTLDDLVALDGVGGFYADLTLPESDPDLPLIDPERTGPAARLLQLYGAAGAGLSGILYDNRDRAHSTLDPGLFPALTRLRYGPGLIARQLDYGLAGALVLPGIVIGNSSTAIVTGPAPRSQTRLAMTSPDGPAQAFRAYAGNALYVYPEHRDHDARDLFPGNWPYTVTSQGSSGSDQAFLEALVMTLAAFPQATRDKLQSEGLIAPTLQMILRRSLHTITSDRAYLSGMAHPPVFDSDALAPGRMIAMAAAMEPDTIPPLVRLTIRAEDFVGAGQLDQSERLYTTPSAIARLWRNARWSREMVLSAAGTFDPNGRPLTFSWVLLRGDPNAVTIEPFGPDQAQARLRLTWHDPGAGALPGWRPGSRIDIAVFVSNGTYHSAPAIVSILLPWHEGRVYAADATGTMVLNESRPIPTLYRDPLLFAATVENGAVGEDDPISQ